MSISPVLYTQVHRPSVWSSRMVSHSLMCATASAGTRPVSGRSIGCRMHSSCSLSVDEVPCKAALIPAVTFKFALCADDRFLWDCPQTGSIGAPRSQITIKKFALHSQGDKACLPLVDTTPYRSSSAAANLMEKFFMVRRVKQREKRPIEGRNMREVAGSAQTGGAGTFDPKSQWQT
mgnify:CR=1 FL=1